MSQYVFSEVPHIEIPRSTFDRSHEYKSTFESAGVLYPILVDEVLPSDTFTIQTSLFCRVATLIAPIMDNLYLDTFYFFVPERLVWNNFQKMCGEQEDPGDSTDYTFPIFYSATAAKAEPAEIPTIGNAQDVGSLADYFGIPTGVGGLHNVRCEPFRCYNLIWNEWFRDENLQSSVTVRKDEKDYIENFALLRRGKRKDYFTSALPWPVKDGTGVELPIHGSASLTGLGLLNGNVPYFNPYSTSNGQFDNINSSTSTDHPTLYSIGAHDESSLHLASSGAIVVSTTPSVLPKINLSNAVTTTINEFREAFQVQRWLERCARSGTRYTEIIRSMFGCVSPDARLQRPEYLGGTTTLIDVNVVPQTSATEVGVSAQGNLSAYAVGLSTNGGGFTKSFTEHGWIIGLACIRSDYTYQQGLNRMWNRRTKYDMYWPTFAHLGEQAILNKEIYAQGIATYVDEETALASDDYKVFGYQERYAEYRYYPSMITGKMRSTYAQSLDYWHLSQKFDSLPVLNSTFIEENPPVDRIIAVPSEPQFLVDIYFNEKCIRPMPLYSVPGLVDHF